MERQVAAFQAVRVIEQRADALWTRVQIERCRVPAAPALMRVVVAVDPPGSARQGADACGLVAAGRAADGTLYAGTGKGVYARTAKDDSWKYISAGMEDDSVQSMVIDSAGTLYVGTNLGLYKGDIDGRWVAITPGYSQAGLPSPGGDRPVENGRRGQ